MLLRICKLSVELFCCMVADFQFRVHHVEGVDVAVVNVQFCVDVVFLQFMYVSHGFCKKRLSISYKRVGRRQTRKVCAPCRSSIDRYLGFVSIRRYIFQAK